MASLDVPPEKIFIDEKKRYEYDFYIKQFLAGNEKIKGFQIEVMLTTGLVDFYFGNFPTILMLNKTQCGWNLFTE